MFFKLGINFSYSYLNKAYGSTLLFKPYSNHGCFLLFRQLILYEPYIFQVCVHFFVRGVVVGFVFGRALRFCEDRGRAGSLSEKVEGL